MNQPLACRDIHIFYAGWGPATISTLVARRRRCCSFQVHLKTVVLSQLLAPSAPGMACMRQVSPGAAGKFGELFGDPLES